MENTVAELPAFDRAWGWYLRNQKRVLLGTVAAIVVVLGITLYVWKQNQVEVSASEDLSREEAKLAGPGGMQNESAEAFLKVANDHPGTAAGARALLRAATIYFTQGKYGDAQTQFQRFSRDYPESQLRGTALLGNASCLEASGKSDEAVVAYKSLYEQRPGDSVVSQAKFAVARIYESQGKLEQARALYEEVSRGDISSAIGNEAGLRAEELAMKLPKPAATNAPVTTPTLTIPSVLSTNKP